LKKGLKPQIVYSRETAERERGVGEGLHRPATEDFVPGIKGGPRISGEAPTPEGSIVAADFEEQRRRRRRGMENRSVALFPDMPTAEEDKC
jgi:hypothetical protein